MDKKEAKTAYLRKQLDDPNVSEYEKQQIRLRLGIETACSEADFSARQGFELLRFVYNYLGDRLTVIRRKMKTSRPFDHFTEMQKTIYYLSGYDSILDEDGLEQLVDVEDFDEIRGLASGLKTIGRLADAELLEPVWKNRKISARKIQQLLAHFRDDEQTVQEFETEIERLIRAHTREILELQNLQ